LEPALVSRPAPAFATVRCARTSAITSRNSQGPACRTAQHRRRAVRSVNSCARICVIEGLEITVANTRTGIAGRDRSTDHTVPGRCCKRRDCSHDNPRCSRTKPTQRRAAPGPGRHMRTALSRRPGGSPAPSRYCRRPGSQRRSRDPARRHLPTSTPRYTPRTPAKSPLAQSRELSFAATSAVSMPSSLAGASLTFELAR
jgi:hypothetical protein